MMKYMPGKNVPQKKNLKPHDSERGHHSVNLQDRLAMFQKAREKFRIKSEKDSKPTTNEQDPKIKKSK